MNRTELDWIIGWGLFLTGAKTINWLANDTKLNLSLRIKRCKKCGDQYQHLCLRCTYRNGHDFTETLEPHNEDAVEGLAALRRDHQRMLETWRWMQATTD
jgi:hypothetical protein